jgi:carbonic anhydrase/acetyltransferase-like protein (isoleucine patch superfamily)
MRLLSEIRDRYRFWSTTDRIGPDIPLTHWRLHFPSLMKKLCQGKFRSFGEQAVFRPGAYALGCSKISIGARVIIRPGTMLVAGYPHAAPNEQEGAIIIEDDAILASGVQIYTNTHKFYDTSRPISQQGFAPPKNVIIRRGAWIGVNAILLPGVEIGQNVVVGAGAVVRRSVPNGSIVMGNPGNIITTRWD